MENYIWRPSVSLIFQRRSIRSYQDRSNRPWVLGSRHIFLFDRTSEGPNEIRDACSGEGQTRHCRNQRRRQGDPINEGRFSACLQKIRPRLSNRIEGNAVGRGDSHISSYGLSSSLAAVLG